MKHTKPVDRATITRGQLERCIDAALAQGDHPGAAKRATGVAWDDLTRGQEEVGSHLTCDFCGTRSIDMETWPGPLKHDVAIRYATSWADRDGGGWTETVTIDCCPACFRDKVLMALVELGAKPRTEHVEH